MPLLATRILAGDPVPINGDGGQSRDFTYIDNVIDANIRASEAEGASGQVFNVATGNPVSVERIADMIGEVTDLPVEKDFRPPRAGDVRDSWADLTAIGATLDWVPRIGLEDGLRRTVDALAGSRAAVGD